MYTANILRKFILLSVSSVIGVLSSNACGTLSNNIDARLNHRSPNQIYIGADFAAPFNVKSSVNDSLTFFPEGYSSTLPNFNVNIGQKINQFWTPEISFGYRDFKQNLVYKHDNVDQESWHRSKAYLLMVNNYFTIPMDSIVEPYVVVGAGISGMKPDSFYNNTLINGQVDTTVSRAKYGTALAYQVGAGATMKMSDKLHINSSIRYINYGTISFADPSYDPIKLHGFEFLLGLKVSI